jgi:hypothetical protein
VQVILEDVRHFDAAGERTPSPSGIDGVAAKSMPEVIA